MMSNPKFSATAILTGIVVPALAIMLGAGPARAQTSSLNITFIVAAGFLCDSADSSACPAVAKSANGESYEMSGAGTFAASSKTATAAGTFTHKSPDGVVLETGIWISKELVSFDMYGLAPGALRREGRAPGPPQFGLSPLGPRGVGMFSAPMPAGGLAVLRIQLVPMSGFSRSATLQVNCPLGKVPDDHQVEGIRLLFDHGATQFDEEIGGHALFLLARPEPTAAAKAATPPANPEPALPEAQQ
jgi:hypothetical protein